MNRTLAVVSMLALVLSLAPVVAAEGDKVVICHVPPGNADAAHTITVGAPAVEEHMGEHGDTLGPCPGDEEGPGSGNDEGNPSEPTGPSPSAVAAFPATWLGLLLVALAAIAVATAYVLRRRRNGTP